MGGENRDGQDSNAKSEAYERAKRQALARLDKPFRMGGVITATRDELHDRKSLRLPEEGLSTSS